MSKGSGQPTDLSALSGLAPELAEMLVSVACDIALVLDDVGVIQSVAVSGNQPVSGAAGEWVGLHWADTVTNDVRRKAKEILDELASTGVSRLRHLNHSSAEGSDIPVAYTAVRLGEHGPTLAVGRDMRLVAAMQQRLMQAQQDIERDYWQRRHSESPYRLLFQQVATQPALILDASSFEVIDANRVAALLLGKPVEQINGEPVTAFIDPAAHTALRDLLDAARTSTRSVDGETRLAGSAGSARITVTCFLVEASKALLLLSVHGTRAGVSDEGDAEIHASGIFADLVRRTPDAIAICDLAGHITLSNQAFRELVQIPAGCLSAGHNLADWIGKRVDSFQEILTLVTGTGSVPLLGTHLRRREDQLIDIELSATLLPDRRHAGFIMRVSHHQDSARPLVADASDNGVH